MFIQMANISRMNEELQSMLMIMPEGIVLVDKEESNVGLANLEFKRLFNISQCTELKGITVLINDEGILHKSNN